MVKKTIKQEIEDEVMKIYDFEDTIRTPVDLVKYAIELTVDKIFEDIELSKMIYDLPIENKKIMVFFNSGRYKKIKKKWCIQTVK